MKTLFDSLARTFTPIIAGAVIGWFVTIGIDLDPEFAPTLIIVITGAFQGLYYLAVRLFELYVSPKFGWLLGLAKTPAYETPEPVLIPVQGPSRDDVLASLVNLSETQLEADINSAAARKGL